jgi:hypothetical protein
MPPKAGIHGRHPAALVAIDNDRDRRETGFRPALE